MHRQGEEVGGVPLLEDPQVVAALISFATVGVEVFREVWHRRDRLGREQERRSSSVEADTRHAGTGCPSQHHRASMIDPPVPIITDIES